MNSRLLYRLLAFLIFIALSSEAFPQHSEHNGWSAILASYKIAPHWSVNLDLHARSDDHYSHLRNAIIMPRLTYHLGNAHQLSLGYGLITTRTQQQVQGGGSTTILAEHRICQQYTHTHRIRNISVTSRLRLEQRFIEQQNRNVFAQRFRCRLRLQMPLLKTEGTFTNGPFAAVSDEVLLHVQNKQDLTGHTFDRNKAYAGLGFRLNPKVDVEGGYINQQLKGATATTANHIIQFSLTTRF